MLCEPDAELLAVLTWSRIELELDEGCTVFRLGNKMVLASSRICA